MHFPRFTNQYLEIFEYRKWPGGKQNWRFFIYGNHFASGTLKVKIATHLQVTSILWIRTEIACFGWSNVPLNPIILIQTLSNVAVRFKTLLLIPSKMKLIDYLLHKPRFRLFYDCEFSRFRTKKSQNLFLKKILRPILESIVDHFLL